MTSAVFKVLCTLRRSVVWDEDDVVALRTVAPIDTALMVLPTSTWVYADRGVWESSAGSFYVRLGHDSDPVWVLRSSVRER